MVTTTLTIPTETSDVALIVDTAENGLPHHDAVNFPHPDFGMTDRPPKTEVVVRVNPK
jgi:hypothetical protein